MQLAGRVDYTAHSQDTLSTHAGAGRCPSERTGDGFGFEGAGVEVLEGGRVPLASVFRRVNSSFRSTYLCVRTQRLTPASAASCSVMGTPVDRDGQPSSSRWIAAVMASRSVVVVGFSGVGVSGDDALQAVELVLLADVSEGGSQRVVDDRP
jgi:hypothetical protein